MNTIKTMNTIQQIAKQIQDVGLKIKEYRDQLDSLKDERQAEAVRPIVSALDRTDTYLREAFAELTRGMWYELEMK